MIQPNTSGRSNPDSHKLIVTNLSDEVDENELNVIFQKFGPCRINLKMLLVFNI